MNEAWGILNTLTVIGQGIGLLMFAVKTGSWKGVTEKRIEELEKDTKNIRVKVDSLGDRVGGVEKEFSKTLASIETSLEFIKKSIDELKNKE